MPLFFWIVDKFNGSEKLIDAFSIESHVDNYTIIR